MVKLEVPRPYSTILNITVSDRLNTEPLPVDFVKPRYLTKQGGVINQDHKVDIRISPCLPSGV